MMVPAAILGTSLLAGLLLPRVWLPSIALVAFCFLPLGYLSVDQTLGRFITPSVVLLLIWEVRVFAAKGFPRFNLVYPGLVLAASIAATVVLQALTERGGFWLLVVAVCVPMAAWAGSQEDSECYRRILQAFFVLGCVMGVIGLTEAVLEFNPLASYYSAGGVPIMQDWSVYRIQTTLGHPLANSAFFAVVSSVSLIEYLNRHRWLPLLSGLLSCAPHAGTASRAGLLAVGIAVAVGSVAVVVWGGRLSFRRAVVIGGMMIGGILIYRSPLVQARKTSLEAQASSEYRERVLSYGIDLFRERPWFGSGPGLAQSTFSAAYGNIILENSAVQLLVSVGIFGTLAIAAFVALACVMGFLSGKWGMGVGVIAFSVSVTGYNAVDSNPAILALLGVLIVGAFGPRSEMRSGPVGRDAGRIYDASNCGSDRSLV